MKKLKILEITAFSAGICGVWTRVLAESKCLVKKGYEVHIFSSNIFRGEEKRLAQSHETIEGINIHRFSTKGSFGQNTFFWSFEEQAIRLKPDIIVTHAYRQYYSTNALKVAKKLGIPCFLVTHAPFLEKKLRSWKLNFAVFLYDSIIGRRILKEYTKVIAITKWEIPYLQKLGLEKKNIVLIPNGIPDDFFKIKPKKRKENNKKLLFLGRIAPIKDIGTLIRAFALLKDKEAKLDLIGPAEEDYKKALINLIKQLKLEKRINFFPAVYDLGKKIETIDKHDLFILPSKREGMPQTLIEVMARGKIAISSNTDGGKEIIKDNSNGLLFKIKSERELAERIDFVLDNKNKKEVRKIKKNAINSVRQFSWQVLIQKIQKTIEY